MLGETVIELLVAPVFQLYIAAPLAVKVSTEPEHIDGADAEAVTVGVGLTVIVILSGEPLQAPVESVTV